MSFSPIPKAIFTSDCDRVITVQRKLSFEHDDMLDNMDDKVDNNFNDHNNNEHGQTMISHQFSDSDSPPYKRMKPLSMLYSSTPCTGRRTPPSKDVSLISLVAMTPKVYPKCEKYCLSPSSLANGISRLNSSAPVNPFTPSGRVIVSANRKRKLKRRKAYQDWFNGSSSSSEDSLRDNNSKIPCSHADLKSILGPSLMELNISRFSEEFKIDEFIASGSFGVVYKCTNYLDGMEYAIKKSAQPVAGTNNEQLARREVFAHAALRSHLHIVTYYSSWIESGHLYIQTEFCNGGSLEQLIKNTKHVFTESNLIRLMNHISKGLKFIHSQNLAHMDIKPANILINKVQKHDTSDEEFDDDDEQEDYNSIYKIGDLGHIIVVDEPYDVEDGDCRYLPKELLNENYENLKKADVFSFGMTLFEAAGGGPLPKNGDQWQNLRNGNIPYLVKYSSNYNHLIRSMLNPEPEKRPDVSEILRQTRVSKGNLHSEIRSYKMKSDFYAQRVLNSGKCFKAFSLSSAVENSPCNLKIPKIVVEKQ